jgi:hypothetical protein
MTFTEDYSKVLSPFLKRYKEAENEKLRKAVSKEAADAVVKSRDVLEDKGDLPKDLEKVCFWFFSFLLLLHCDFDIYIFSLQAIARYFKRSIKKESTAEGGAPKPRKMKQVYTMRDVIKEKYRHLVEEEIPYNPTDKEYLGEYQKAVTKALEKMSPEDLEEVQEIVDSWNAQGVPSEMKLK